MSMLKNSEKQPRKCYYAMCKSNSSNTKVFAFPVRDETRTKAWVHATGNKKLRNLDNNQLKRRYVCSKHFMDGHFMDAKYKLRLTPAAVPYRYDDTSGTPGSSHSVMESRDPLRVTDVCPPEVAPHIKQKFDVGPTVLQPTDHLDMMVEPKLEQIKEEPLEVESDSPCVADVCSPSATLAVKQEIEVGPTVLQPIGGLYMKVKPKLEQIKEEISHWIQCGGSQLIRSTAPSSPALIAGPCTPTAEYMPQSDDEIDIINYGSEEESNESDDDNDVSRIPIVVPKAVRMFLEPTVDPVEAEPPAAAVCLQWPLPEAPIPAPDRLFFPRDKFHFIWKGFPEVQTPSDLRREYFSTINCGPTTSYADPYSAFIAIWDRQIMELVVRETNRYAQQVCTAMLESGSMRPNSRITRWKDTDVDEMYTYFAIILATGIVVKSHLEEYWNSSRDIFTTPEFSGLMSYDRFHLLSTCLHFEDNNACDPDSMTRTEAKLFKVRPIVDHLNDKFSLLYNMGQNVVLDESLTPWKGWLDINQFIPDNNITVGIKTYEVYESQTGYLWRFDVDVGHNLSSSEQDNPISGSIPSLVLRLLRGLELKGHTIWMGNFYNSPSLARELKVLGFDCVGTLRTNRQFVPIELTNSGTTYMVENPLYGCTSGDVDIIVWRHRNRVALISTYHGLDIVTSGGTQKPTVIADYTACMGGIDRKDQMIAMHPIERRTRIWYKKFFKRLLNASVLNAYILYGQGKHRNFRKELIRAIIAHHTPSRPHL